MNFVISECDRPLAMESQIDQFLKAALTFSLDEVLQKKGLYGRNICGGGNLGDSGEAH